MQMAKELYLYSSIYDFVAEELMTAMEDCNGEDITMRINSGGGNAFATHGICAKITELGNVNIQVDGVAMSSAANICLYGKSVECLDVTKFLFHRADMYVENPQDQAFLDNVNKDLKAKMKAKIDAAKFKEVTGISIDEMFASDKRVDVILSAKDAKKIGLVSKIKTLTPSEVTAMNNKLYAVSASAEPVVAPKQEITVTKIKTMTLQEIKANNPALYNEIFALGVAAEKDRTGSFLAFIDIDAKAVVEGIKGDKTLSATAMAEFTRKGMNVQALKVIEAEAPKELTTAEIEAKKKEAETEEEKEINEFRVSVKKQLNVK